MRPGRWPGLFGNETTHFGAVCDGFPYGQAIRKVKVPPVLYLAGHADTYMGHPNDVRDFREEVGSTGSAYFVLGRRNGNLHDYGHIDMLTHPDAAKDHFPAILHWLRHQ